MVIGRAIDIDYSKLTIALQQVAHTGVRTPGSGPTFGHVLINKMPAKKMPANAKTLASAAVAVSECQT